MRVDLSGRTALVTGAGRGIGRAVARQLAEAGARVMINDLDAEPALETRSMIEQAGGCAKEMPGDITAPEFPDQLVRATLAEFGSIDVIVNNAGYTWDSPIRETTDEQFQAMLDIHLFAPFRVLRAAAPWIRDTAKKEMRERRPVMRKIVNVTSISGIDGISNQTAYGSGKAGVVGLTKVLAKEWGRFSVNVNAVAFGFIETRLTQPTGTPGAEIEVHGKKIPIGVQPVAIEMMKLESPLGHLGSAEQAAGPVLFFCSPWSDYVTGEVLMCSGGTRLR